VTPIAMTGGASAVRRIRILLGLPADMRVELRRSLAGADDVLVVGEAMGSIEILQATGHLRPDEVVLPMSDDDVPGVATHLLSEYPDVKPRQIVVVAPLAPRLGRHWREAQPAGRRLVVERALRRRGRPRRRAGLRRTAGGGAVIAGRAAGREQPLCARPG
jgi:hypothetical protein